jgi:hypothetical protein
MQRYKKLQMHQCWYLGQQDLRYSVEEQDTWLAKALEGFLHQDGWLLATRLMSVNTM